MTFLDFQKNQHLLLTKHFVKAYKNLHYDSGIKKTKN